MLQYTIYRVTMIWKISLKNWSERYLNYKPETFVNISFLKPEQHSECRVCRHSLRNAISGVESVNEILITVRCCLKGVPSVQHQWLIILIEIIALYLFSSLWHTKPKPNSECTFFLFLNRNCNGYWLMKGYIVLLIFTVLNVYL